MEPFCQQYVMWHINTLSGEREEVRCGGGGQAEDRHLSSWWGLQCWSSSCYTTPGSCHLGGEHKNRVTYSQTPMNVLLFYARARACVSTLKRLQTRWFGPFQRHPWPSHPGSCLTRSPARQTWLAAAPCCPPEPLRARARDTQSYAPRWETRKGRFKGTVSAQHSPVHATKASISTATARYSLILAVTLCGERTDTARSLFLRVFFFFFKNGAPVRQHHSGWTAPTASAPLVTTTAKSFQLRWNSLNFRFFSFKALP